jgi:hypothetical protein
MVNAPDLVRKKPVDGAVLDARERAGRWKYPPSFRRALAEHGLFTLGKVTPQSDHLCFVVWPPKEHVSALALLAEQLGCDADGASVAAELGIPETDAAALEHLVVIGAEGHEDFCAFDTRTRNPKTGECSFRLVLFDDLEIADAAKPTKPPKGDGFDAWIAKHVQRRAEDGRNDEPAPEPAKPIAARKAPKSPKPMKSFATLGAFSVVPRRDVEKRITKLLSPKKLGKDIWWSEGELPEVAFVHRGAIRGRDLKLGGAEAGIYVIEGDVSIAGYLNFDVGEDVIVLVAGDVKTPNLRINFATTLLVEGKLSADYVVSEGLVHFAVAGKVSAKRIFLYDDDQRPKLGGKTKGVVVPFWDLDDVVGDAHYHQAPDADVLFKKMIRGKKFLAD